MQLTDTNFDYPRLSSTLAHFCAILHSTSNVANDAIQAATGHGNDGGQPAVVLAVHPALFCVECGLNTCFGESGDRDEGLRDGGSIPDVVQSEFGSTVVTRQPDTHAALPSGEKLPFVGSDEGLRRHLLVGLEVVAVGADVT